MPHGVARGVLASLQVLSSRTSLTLGKARAHSSNKLWFAVLVCMGVVDRRGLLRGPTKAA